MRKFVRIAVVAVALTGALATPLLAQLASESSSSKGGMISAVGSLAPRRGFNVVLLLGDMQGGDAQDTIPVAARKALADMKDFLPYKNYRLLDTQWIIGGSTPAITRLRGVDEQEYEFELHVSTAMTLAPAGGYVLSPTGVAVRFVLREPAETVAPDGTRSPFPTKEMSKGDAMALEISREIFQLERERDDLQLQLSKKRKDVEVGMASPDDVKRMDTQLSAVRRRISDLKQTVSAASVKTTGRAVIDTSFQMADGETVVVGTSKVRGGGKALIALLTATTDRPKGSTK